MPTPGELVKTPLAPLAAPELANVVVDVYDEVSRRVLAEEWDSHTTDQVRPIPFLCARRAPPTMVHSSTQNPVRFRSVP